MNEKGVLGVLRLPARLDVRGTAELLGFQEYEIPVLVRLRLLKPLGSPAPNGHKWFSTRALLELTEDDRWLARASDAVVGYFREKNSKQNREAPLPSPLESKMESVI